MRIEELEPTEEQTIEKRPLIQDITEIHPTHSQTQSTINLSSIAQSAEKLDFDQQRFSFNYIEKATLPGYNDKVIQENLFKWGMQEHMYLKRFSYDQYLNPLQIDDFLLQFFNNPNVNPHMRVR